jgi:hypothetical protein
MIHAPEKAAVDGPRCETGTTVLFANTGAMANDDWQTHGQSPGRHPDLLIRRSLNAGLLSSAAAASCSPILWRNTPFQAERHSGEQQKLFAFRPESRSASTGFPTPQHPEHHPLYRAVT